MNNESSATSTSEDKIVFMHCTLPQLGAVLDYEIPPPIRPFLKKIKGMEVPVGIQVEGNANLSISDEEMEFFPVLI